MNFDGQRMNNTVTNSMLWFKQILLSEVREVGAYCNFYMQIHNLPGIDILNRDVHKQQVYGMGMSVVNNPLKFIF